jgi:hypothetical protein
MSWKGLRYKGTEILRSTEWNLAVAALDELYGWLTSGTRDIYVDELFARSGYFETRIISEGRPVILDGDPITVYQFGDIAVNQITYAIDRSSYLAEISENLGRIYGQLDLIAQYTRDSRDVLVRLRIDEYGNIGVKISEPLDEYGRVLISFPNDLLEEYKSVWAMGSITAEDNTSGFYVDLYKGGRPNLNIYYRVGGASTIFIKGSVDGITWRTIETLIITAAGEKTIIFQGIAYPYIRVETPTAGIDVEFELVASR